MIKALLLFAALFSAAPVSAQWGYNRTSAHTHETTSQGGPLGNIRTGNIYVNGYLTQSGTATLGNFGSGNHYLSGYLTATGSGSVAGIFGASYIQTLGAGSGTPGAGAALCGPSAYWCAGTTAANAFKLDTYNTSNAYQQSLAITRDGWLGMGVTPSYFIHAWYSGDTYGMMQNGATSGTAGWRSKNTGADWFAGVNYTGTMSSAYEIYNVTAGQTALRVSSSIVTAVQPLDFGVYVASNTCSAATCSTTCQNNYRMVGAPSCTGNGTDADNDTSFRSGNINEPYGGTCTQTGATATVVYIWCGRVHMAQP